MVVVVLGEAALDGKLMMLSFGIGEADFAGPALASPSNKVSLGDMISTFISP